MEEKVTIVQIFVDLQNTITVKRGYGTKLKYKGLIIVASIHLEALSWGWWILYWHNMQKSIYTTQDIINPCSTLGSFWPSNDLSKQQKSVLTENFLSRSQTQPWFNRISWFTFSPAGLYKPTIALKQQLTDLSRADFFSPSCSLLIQIPTVFSCHSHKQESVYKWFVQIYSSAFPRSRKGLKLCISKLPVSSFKIKYKVL